MNDIDDTEHNTTILYSQRTELQSNVLLKTAVAQVGSNQFFIDTDILFDEGGQTSFETQNLTKFTDSGNINNILIGIWRCREKRETHRKVNNLSQNRCRTRIVNQSTDSTDDRHAYTESHT